MEHDYISSDEDEEAAEHWEPIPVSQNKPAKFISSQLKKNDIISITPTNKSNNRVQMKRFCKEKYLDNSIDESVSKETI